MIWNTFMFLNAILATILVKINVEIILPKNENIRIQNIHDNVSSMTTNLI